MIAGNVTAIADKMVITAMLARDGGYLTFQYLNSPNDQVFAQKIVTGLSQAGISPKDKLLLMHLHKP